jgi:hypothetical protein
VITGVTARRWLFGILALILGAALISGAVADGSSDTQRAVYATATWPAYLFIYAWMKADARARGSQPPPGAIPLILVLLPIAVPYYLLATRHRWRKLVSVCFLTGYIGIVLVLLGLGEMCGHWLVA